MKLSFSGVIVTAILYKIFSHFHPIKVHDGHIIRWPYIGYYLINLLSWLMANNFTYHSYNPSEEDIPHP